MSRADMMLNEEEKPVEKAGTSIWRSLRLGAVAALIVLPTAWGAGKLLEPGRLPVRHLDIYGAERADLKKAEKLTMEHVQQGLFHTDVHALSKSLEEVDWVDRVAVRRMWPDRLVMTLTEYKPVARWGEKAWLNDRGDVFQAVEKDVPQGLPQFQAPDRDSKEILKSYLALEAQLKAASMGVIKVNVDRRLAWRLQLNNGISLNLGRKDLQARVERFTRAWTGLLAPYAERIQHIDLRYPHGLAVAWRTNTSDLNADKGTEG